MGGMGSCWQGRSSTEEVMHPAGDSDVVEGDGMREASADTRTLACSYAVASGHGRIRALVQVDSCPCSPTAPHCSSHRRSIPAVCRQAASLLPQRGCTRIRQWRSSTPGRGGEGVTSPTAALVFPPRRRGLTLRVGDTPTGRHSGRAAPPQPPLPPAVQSALSA